MAKRIMPVAITCVVVCLLAALTSGLWAQPLQGQEKETPSVRTDSPSSLSEAAQTTAIASSAVRRDNNITPGIRGDAQQTGTAQGSPLWDNDLVPDGVNGRAISPPGFPDIRVVDDFVIPAGEEWVIQDFHTNIIEDADWTDGGVAQIYIYDDNNNSPGNLIVNISNLPFTKIDTGDEFFGRVDYDYSIEGLDIPLGPGRYWIGSRYPNGGGVGNNWWMTSSGQPDGPDTSGWLSLDAGQTWDLEGNPDWDHAFTVTGFIVGPPDGLLNQPPNQSNGIFSDVDCEMCGSGVQILAENFNVDENRSIGLVRIFGGYFPDDLPPVDAFTVNFHSDDGGVPGVIINSQTVPATQTLTGVELFGVREYQVDIEIVELSLSPGTYWVSVYNDTSPHTDSFFWEVGDLDPVHGLPGSGFRFDIPGPGGWSFDPATDLAITLMPPDNSCPWDLDGNGSVGASDLLALFAQWGSAGSADFDGNGTVGTGDLLILLANWGPCASGAECANPGNCDDGFPECGDPGCGCFTLFHGGGICVNSGAPCDLLPCPDGDCPPGEYCVILSCCGENVCVPPEYICGNGGIAPPPPGTKTMSGISGQD